MPDHTPHDCLQTPAAGAVNTRLPRNDRHTTLRAALRVALLISTVCAALAVGGMLASDARAQDQPCSGPACAAENGQDFAESQDARENAPACEGRSDYSEQCQDAVDESTGDGGGQEGGSGFADVVQDKPSYEAYPLSHYQFAFFIPDDQEAGWFFSEKKAQNAIADWANGQASGIFVVYVMFMRAAVTILEWVLTLDLVTSMNQVISEGIRGIGEGLIGSPGAFSIGVKIAWLVGMCAVALHVLRARMASAMGTAAVMLIMTAVCVMVISNSGQVIKWYTGFTNALASEVMTMASGHEGEPGTQDDETRQALDQMWESFVIVPFGYIQVSSDTAVAARYDEQALATPLEDRPDALEGIQDEPGVQERASNIDWIMHIVWALVTLLFGVMMALLMLAAGMVVLVFEFVAIIALLTMPVWLLFSIIMVAGLSRQMLMWFVNINLDVIFAHLIIALFTRLVTVVLGLNTVGEDMALIMRFLLALGCGIAVFMLVFGIRSVVRASSFGRSGLVDTGGMGRKAGVAVAAMSGGTGAGTSAAGALGSAGSSSGGTGDKHQALSGGSGEQGAAGGASTRMDNIEKRRNEADRKERGEEPPDNRSGKKKTWDRLGKVGANTGGIAWNSAGTAGKVGKAAVGAAAKKIPKAGLVAARSGFSPFETAAAFGGADVAAAGGALWGGAASKGGSRRTQSGIVGRFRQRQQDKKAAARFEKDGEELTEKAAARMEEDDLRRDAAVEQNAREAYLENEQPATASGGAYPAQAPVGTPEGAAYDPQTGAVTMDAADGQEAPEGPAGYQYSTQTSAPPGQAPREQHVWTPNKDPAAMRGEAYDRAETERRAQREEAYKARGSVSDGALVTDANGNVSRDHASRTERDRDAAEDRMRDNQRAGIVAAGGSSFDGHHAANRQRMAANPPQKGQNESQQSFERRKAAHENKVKNYDPARNAPKPAFSSSSPSLQEIKDKDPEGFRKHYANRAKQEFSPDQYKRMKEAKERREDPLRSRGSWDQTPYMETARKQVKEGINRGDSDGSIITGMKEPESGEGPQMQRFQDRLRQVNDSWVKNGPKEPG